MWVRDSYVWGLVFYVSGLRILTFGGQGFLRLGVSFLTFGVSFLTFGGYGFLRLRVSFVTFED